jgi:CDP-diacylglycerol---serine O-phosphatidyltransferase
MKNQHLNEEKKTELLADLRRQRLSSIAILPSLITLVNGLCGFSAIVFASRGFAHISFRDNDFTYFAAASYMLFLAMIADMLDGRIARMSRTTSSFGGQLDSLCDMVSFGIAPAFLLLKVLSFKLSAMEPFTDPTPAQQTIMGRFIWLAAALYMICAAIRLARFNVENEQAESKHMSFVGLPSPAAAGVLASMIIYYQNIITKWDMASRAYEIGEAIIIYSLPFIAIGVSVLMISRIPFPHLINHYLKGKKPVAYLFWAVAIGALVFLCGIETALLVCFSGFVVSGFIKWLYLKFVVSRSVRQIPEPPVLKVSGYKDSADD